MKFLATILIILTLWSAQPVLAQPVQSQTLPPPTISGQSAVLMDAQTGKILYDKNPHERLPIASITKIMTAIVALDKGNLNAQVTVGDSVLDRNKVYGTLLYLEPGEKFTLRQLMYGMLLNSANDAAVAVAQYIGGSVDQFVRMMNDEANHLGATDTHFVNPDGLSEPNHYSSAADMAVFARYAMQNPTFREIVRTKSMVLPRSKPNLPTQLENINKMLWLYPDIDGVKTGYTEEAGHTIIASSSRNGRRLIAVILKEPFPRTTYTDAENLLNYGFNSTYNQTLAKGNQLFTTVPVSDGQKLQLAPKSDVIVTQEDSDPIHYSLKVIPSKLSLPIKAGQVKGNLEVLNGNILVQTVPLVALNSVSAPAWHKAGQSKFLWIFGSFCLVILLLLVRKRLKKLRRTYRVRNKAYRFYR